MRYLQYLAFAAWLILQLPEPSLAQEPGAPENLVLALDLDPAQVTDFSVVGDTSASSALDQLGVLRPVRGSRFLYLTTGRTDATQAEPGHDFPPQGSTNGDEASVTIEIKAPSTGWGSFVYQYLSAEYPEFVGFHNDIFEVFLTDFNGRRALLSTVQNDVGVLLEASDQLTGGTAFHLFTQDPTGINLEFGDGPNADAASTTQRVVEFAFSNRVDGTIELEFRVRDDGDGNVDSAVFLDNLSISATEVVDPTPDLSTNTDPGMLLTSGRINPDFGALRGPASRRIGIVADGTSKLLLRSRTDGPGVVRFRLIGGTAPQDGSLSSTTGPLASSVTTPVDTSAQQAYAVYTAPTTFFRGSNGADSQRFVNIRTEFTPTGETSPTIISETPIVIVRPPLVLVHGIYTSPATWTFPAAFDRRWRFRARAAYASTSDQSFVANAPRVLKTVNDVRRRCHLFKFSCTQMDFVGHSMGGPLVRQLTNLDAYLTPENFQAGFVHKLISIGGPHHGTPLADVLLQAAEASFAVRKAMKLLNKVADRGGLQDAATDSTTLASLGATLVPSHAIVGTGGSDRVEFAPTFKDVIELLVNFGLNFTLGGVFDGETHDGFVPTSSQRGGIHPFAVTTIPGGDGLHSGSGNVNFQPVGMTGSRIISDRVLELLDTPLDDSTFASWPAPNLGSANPSVEAAIERLSELTVAETGSTSIISPASGSILRPGSVMVFLVSAPPGAERVVLVAPGMVASATSPPFEVSARIPEISGDFTVGAFSIDGSNVDFAQDVSYSVVPAAQLNALAMEPKEMVIEAGTTLPTVVLGAFADGMLRQINTLPGVIYQAMPEGVVAVDANGTVRALTPGDVTIRAIFGDLQASATWSVTDGGLIFADGFEDNFGDWEIGNGPELLDSQMPE